MARIDHEERRRTIAEAVWRLLESGGLEAASVRRVVAETGLSSGSIRHFFSTQAELHEFAMASLAERVRERIGRAAGEPDPGRRAVAMVGELMPLRDDTERELGVWLAFIARSRHDEGLARILHEQAVAVREFLTTVVVDLERLGLHDAGTDLDAAVTRLNAVVDGLTFELLATPGLVTRAQAIAELRAALFTRRTSEVKEDAA